MSTASQGGAGIVASVLNRELNKIGIESSISYLMSQGLREAPLEHPSLTLAAAIDEFLVKRAGISNQVSVVRSRQSRSSKVKLEDFEVIHLHWIEGYLNSADIDSLLQRGLKVVWTLHDMRPFTGACHHAGDCVGFYESCARCPQVRLPFRRLVEVSLLKKTRSLLNSKKDIRFVAPSSWMSNKAAHSPIVSASSLQVIPNPIDSVFFEPVHRISCRSALGIQRDTKVVTVVAKNLTDPNKQIQNIVHEFERFANSSHHLSLLLLVGDGGDEIISGPLVRRLGNLTPQELKNVYSATDLVVSASKVESFGLTLSEGAALGVPSLATSGHAASEGIVDGDNGFIISDYSKLSEKLSAVFSLNSDELKSIGAKGRDKVHKESHPTFVANSYYKIYEELLRG